MRAEKVGELHGTGNRERLLEGGETWPDSPECAVFGQDIERPFPAQGAASEPRTADKSTVCHGDDAGLPEWKPLKIAGLLHFLTRAGKEEERTVQSAQQESVPGRHLDAQRESP